MMTNKRHILSGLLFAALIAPAGLANAAQTTNVPDMPARIQSLDTYLPKNTAKVEVLYAQRQPQGRISASQAKAAAMQKVRGARFINVQPFNKSTYRVRLQQKNGKIIDVYVDAYTGRVKN